MAFLSIWFDSIWNDVALRVFPQDVLSDLHLDDGTTQPATLQANEKCARREKRVAAVKPVQPVDRARP